MQELKERQVAHSCSYVGLEEISSVKPEEVGGEGEGGVRDRGSWQLLRASVLQGQF